MAKGKTLVGLDLHASTSSPDVVAANSRINRWRPLSPSGTPNATVRTTGGSRFWGEIPTRWQHGWLRWPASPRSSAPTCRRARGDDVPPSHDGRISRMG
jgi:hypothetical protein